MNKEDKNNKTVEAYDKNPQFYADKFDSYDIRREDIDRGLKLNESGSDKVLELGCGSGREAQYIISKVGVSNYLGLDASIGLLDRAKQKNPGADFNLIDVRGMDVSSETFGVIFTFFFMVHMKHEEMAQILDKCHKILKTGGILYIISKYGEYREEETKRFGDEKYHYFYKIEDFEKIIPYKFFMIYKDIQDIKHLTTFTIALRKI